jgi:hypothetical protein
MSGRKATFFAAALLAGATAWLPRSAPALPIQSALTLQPIDVCDTAGANCAVDPGNAAFFSNLQAVMTAVWAQAGLAPVLLAPQKLNIGTVATPAGRYGLVTDVNTAAPVDGFRLLTRTPGNGQSPNPTTLNLYLVDSLVTPGQIVRGVSFINGNGLVVSDASVLDTAAHETGHNLALDHTTFGAGGANNLMTTGGVRTIPASIGDINPNGAKLDQLTVAQIARATQPLFSVALGRVDSTPFVGGNCSATDTCYSVDYLPPPLSTGETLNSVVFKYGPGVSVNGFSLISDPAATVSSHTFATVGGFTQLTVNFKAGAFGQNAGVDFQTSSCLGGLCSPVPNPVSVIFNFEDGFSSQAGFDAATGADSAVGSFGFEGTPGYGVGVDVPPGVEVSEVDVTVPEPQSLALLAAWLVGFGVARRRNSRST